MIPSGLGFDGVAPEATGRPSYHPSGLLKLYIYGYLNRVQSSRRLEKSSWILANHDSVGPGVRWGGSRGDRAAFISSLWAAEALHLRLPQSRSVESAA